MSFVRAAARWGLALLSLLAFSSTYGSVIVAAHRGGSLYAPENTISSFRLAAGVTDLMETDAHISSDGKFIIMHDATVDRTTDGTGSIVSKTLPQIKALDAGSWFSAQFIGERVPTMEEMISNSAPAIPFIEAKAGTATAYAAEFQRLNVVTNIIFQSFDWNLLSQTHALLPDLKLCALGSGTMTAASLISITNAGARMVSWEGVGVGTNEVILAHSMGLTLLVWTIDSASEIQRFINMGVDGIVTNDPWTAKNLPPPISTATNQPTFLADRLIAYWKLDDGLTNTMATAVADNRGGNNATLVRNDGNSHWLSGGNAKLGGALQVAYTNAFLNMPSNAVMNIGTNELTMSTWVRLDNLPAQLPTSFGAIFDSTTDCYVLYLDKSANELRFKVTDVVGHAARPGIGAGFLVTNQWLHIAATFNGHASGSAGHTAIYLNGVLMDNHVGNDNTAGSGLIGNVKAGQVAAMGREGPTGGNGFYGAVDDLAIWKRALAQSEIQQVYNAGVVGLSLGDLLRQPTSLIEFVGSVRNGNNLEITFRNLGPWQTFGLLRASQMNGPYLAVPGLAPTSLGGNLFRFASPMNGGPEYFRIEGQ